MLQITIPATEMWNEANQEFIVLKEQRLQLEHSLISLSKWESKWCKPFFSKEPKTSEETLDYIACMSLSPNVDADILSRVTKDNIAEINKYIEAPMTATRFSDTGPGGRSREQITAELIYYWMITYNIPVEFQKWHINRLLTLIQVCTIKNQPPKKMSKREIMSRNTALNEQRRRQLNTKG